jgi:diguanylate cyclase (GGDEF)-like protein
MNPVSERLTGLDFKTARGEQLITALKVVDENTGDEVALPLDACMSDAETKKLSGELLLIREDGTKRPINVKISPIWDYHQKVNGSVLVLQDVSETREMSNLLAYQASHDDLTGLLNRREFENRLQDLIEIPAEKNTVGVLCYMDLDQFKLINDACGHLEGDKLVRQVAGLLASHIRDQYYFARLGADEFGLLLESCSLDKALDYARELIELIKDFRFVVQGKSFEVGMCIGLVSLKPGEQTLTDVMSYADLACHIAKEKGRNRIHWYQDDDDTLNKRRGEMEWVQKISQAYSENRFVLYAQEIVPIVRKKGDKRHFEVLLRMLDDAGNIILPSAYISAAERYNLMPDMDKWVISNVFSKLSRHLEGINYDPADIRKFAINLSGQSLGNIEMHYFVKEQFNKYPKLTSYIIFEITETAAISNMAMASDFISTIREKGVLFSLDDFGSGLSSFSYLKNLPVDYLKIDGEFVKDMSYDPVNFAMVASINQIGHVMDIKTIAEHVDSNDVLESLSKLGVNYGQGNWLSEPVRIEDALQ